MGKTLLATERICSWRGNGGNSLLLQTTAATLRLERTAAGCNTWTVNNLTASTYVLPIQVKHGVRMALFYIYYDAAVFLHECYALHQALLQVVLTPMLMWTSPLLWFQRHNTV